MICLHFFLSLALIFDQMRWYLNGSSIVVITNFVDFKNIHLSYFFFD
jgi:hypothetical protein